MNIKCYGWYLNQNNEVCAKLPISTQLVRRSGETVSCSQNCETCLYDFEDVVVNCPGVRSTDGDFRFSFTVRTAKRVNNEITCDLLPEEGKCPDCLLKLRRKMGR